MKIFLNKFIYVFLLTFSFIFSVQSQDDIEASFSCGLCLKKQLPSWPESFSLYCPVSENLTKEHNFCTYCIYSHIKHKYDFSCPTCREPISVGTEWEIYAAEFLSHLPENQRNTEETLKKILNGGKVNLDFVYEECESENETLRVQISELQSKINSLNKQPKQFLDLKSCFVGCTFTGIFFLVCSYLAKQPTSLSVS